MQSYWEKNYSNNKYDIVVIGSGLVGLCTAIELRKIYPQKSICIFEKHHQPYGASTKNAGFACFGSIGEILDDLKTLKESEVENLLTIRYQGLQMMQNHVQPSSIDLKYQGGYEVFISQHEFEKVGSHIDTINDLVRRSISVEQCFTVEENPMSSDGFYSKVICNRYEGQLNPGLLVNQLLKKAHSEQIHIQYNAEVTHLQDTGSYTNLEINNRVTIRSEKVVLCANAYSTNVIKDLDIIPYRNQVIISKPIDNLELAGTFHLDKGYTYFRNIDNRILIGGARNLDLEEEQTLEFGDNPKILSHLLQLGKTINPKFEHDYSWSGILATGKSKSPIIERHKPNIYIASRMGGMGVAISSWVGYRVAQLIYKTYNNK